MDGGRDGIMWPVGRRSSRQGDEKRKRGGRGEEIRES